MLTVRTIAALRAELREWRGARQRIAFVPTMGNLHDGHTSLLAEARARGDRVIASVFVNPLQFGPNEDFNAYPRTPVEDERLLRDAGCDLLFAPGVEEIYPGGGTQATHVTVGALSEILDGQFRPGHFDGVATVVAKLFGIVGPDVAVFGEKDYQQLMVVRRMTEDLSIPVEIVGAPTVRANDGLALSSRNRYLSADERARAPSIYRALLAAVRAIDAGGADFAALERDGIRALERASMQPEYFAIRAAHDLAAPDAASKDLVVLTAVRMGRARLIDNLRARSP